MNNLENKNIKDLDAFKNLTDEEKALALQILGQMASTGESEILDDLKFSDFEEIPVDIDTFLDDDRYLGKGLWAIDQVTGERKCTLFPYWRETLHKLFPDNLTTNYNTLILTGSIGLGKTQCAVLAMLYLLYRMLCLKDPYGYYGMMPIDKITFSLLNITIDTAKGVAWDKLQQLLQNSEWFMAHGSLNASRVAPTWQPDKHIELIFGSSNNHVIGRALFCLDGETEILTANGVAKIKDLVNKPIQVWNLNNNNNKVLGPICTVKPTLTTNINYQISLTDGSVINCTADHLFKLTTGEYKKAKDLTIDDELAEPKLSYFEFIDNIIQTRGQFGLSNNIYWEGHHIIPKCFGGTCNSKHKDPNIIRLLPEEHYIAHKLLAEENPENKKLVAAFEMMIHPKGKTKRYYEVSKEDYALARRLWSEHMKNDNLGNKKTGHPWNYRLTKKTDVRIKKQSIAQIGKNTWTKNRAVSEETRHKMSQAVKQRYIDDPSSFYKKGNYQKKCITNGKINKYINSNNSLPNGYVYGMTRHSNKKYKFSNERKLEYSKKFSGKNNPMYGNGSLLLGGRNGHATIRYFYDNLQFECRKDLLFYLQRIDPKIVSSTIRKLLAGSKRVCREHPILAKLRWEEK